MERLQKFLSRAGVTSRRRAEELISQGQVKVNDKIIKELGVKIDPEKDKVYLNGGLIVLPKRKVYLALNKPVGYLTTCRDTHQRQTVMDLLPQELRLYPVGRLDLNTEGLLLFTNDGDFANRIMHPKFKLEKEYLCLVKGRLEKGDYLKLNKGIRLKDGETLRARVSRLSLPELSKIKGNVHSSGLRAQGSDMGKKKESIWLRIIIREGKKRQIRRMCLSIRHPVLRLIRIRIGNVKLGNLPVGRWREISDLATFIEC